MPTRTETRKSNRRGWNLTTEHQRRARACVKTESLRANGRKGFEAVARKYGPHKAARVAANYRRNNPSTPEKIVGGWLDELEYAYEREWEAPGLSGLFFDIKLKRRRVVIEIDGDRLHGAAAPQADGRLARDGIKARYAVEHGLKLFRISEGEARTGSGRPILAALLAGRFLPCPGHDATLLDESLAGHRLHCPSCDMHLTSLLLCPTCGRRYELEET